MKRKKHKNNTLNGGVDKKWAQAVAAETKSILQYNKIPEGKMSEIVLEYAEPLVAEFLEYEEDQVMIIEMGCILWNLVFMKRQDEELFREAENRVINILYREPFYLEPDGALNLISDMLKRWEQEYSWCRRMIVDKKIEKRKSGLHLSVVSSILEARTAEDTHDTDNEPCPCGSGKKRKKCCLNSNAATQHARVRDEAGNEHSSFSGRGTGFDIHPYAIVKMVQNPSEHVLKALSKRDLKKLSLKWNIGKVAGLETDDIVDRLHTLGIDASRSAFVSIARDRTSAWSIGNMWAEEIDILGRDDEDLVCLAACELWKRYCPERPSEEMVDDWVAEGYEFLEAHEAENAIHIWLKVWEHVCTRLEPSMKTFDSVDPVFKITQCFLNWIQDFEMELLNAARMNKEYAELGIKIIREVLNRFEKEDENTILNFRCSLGHLCFCADRAVEGEEVFRSVIRDSPHSSHGYVALSDALSDPYNTRQDIPRAITLLEQALAFPVKDADAWDVDARLADLCSKMI